jgi:NAD(P)H-dependent flavin oxidoreductase YrpB (nitropropane dioxygenase family)
MLLGTMVLPVLIQGGMGAAISGWRLAREVSLLGQLGVVSGTAINSVMARRLQDGDAGGHVRRALEHFPEPEAAHAVIARYFQPEGRRGRPYRLCAMPSARPSLRFLREVVLGAFAEVFLAKEGHAGIVGINFLEKIQFPNLAGLYGALLAGVDYVLMGAGIPREIPGALERLAAHEPASLRVALSGPSEVEHRTHFDPRAVLPGLRLAPLVRPSFLAIISSATLAAHLLRNPTGRIDGFVIELPSAGGHNAPPRGPLQLDAAGEPVYGPKDVPDLAAIRALGLPFWLAGCYGSSEKLREARALGAAGIQVGTAFAFCEESGLAEPLRRAALEKWAFEPSSPQRVRTDPQASPTAFPFKVVPLEHTLSDPAVYAARQRHCDLGYLRQVVEGADGKLVYRCPAEPIEDFLAKGGRIEETTDRKCLCNALMANAGLAQTGPDGWTEPALVTAGDDLIELRRFFPAGRSVLHARDVVEQLLA